MSKKSFDFEIENNVMTMYDYFETIKIRTNYYDIKAKKFKNEYYFYSIMTIIISSLVSIFTLLDGVNKWSIIAAILSGSSGVMQTWVKVNRSYYKMVNYRYSCDCLRREQRLYARNAGEYSGANRDQKFVERCESIIEQEEFAWKNTYEKGEGDY